MDIFYIIVSSIAVVILVLLLTYVGIKIKSARSGSTTYPPNYSSCPDYWTANSDGTCTMTANNTGKFGSTSTGIPSTQSTSTPGYVSNTTVRFFGTDAGSTWTSKGMTPQCAMKYWSNQNGIVWDGISNFNGCGF